MVSLTGASGRDGERDHVPGMNHDVLTHRSTPAPDRIRQEPERTRTSEERPRDGEGVRRVAACNAEPNPLDTAHRVDDHVGKAAVFHLEHGRAFGIGSRLRVRATAAKGNPQSQKRSVANGEASGCRHRLRSSLCSRETRSTVAAPCVGHSNRRRDGGASHFIVSNTVLEPATRWYEEHGFVRVPMFLDSRYRRGNIRMERELGSKDPAWHLRAAANE